MQKKIQCAFRLYQDSIDQLDKLVESPPEWLASVVPGPVQDRTEVIERLIFIAAKHHSFGQPANHGSKAETPEPASRQTAKKPSVKAKR